MSPVFELSTEQTYFVYAEETPPFMAGMSAKGGSASGGNSA